MLKSVPDIKQIVYKVIGEVLPQNHPQSITESSILVNDLGASELDLAEILMHIEWKLHIMFPDRDEGTRKTYTVGRLTKRVLACYRREYGRLRC